MFAIFVAIYEIYAIAMYVTLTSHSEWAKVNCKRDNRKLMHDFL